MLKHSLISNKFYVYANTIVKLKKINKTSNKLFIQKLSNGEQVVLPYMQSDLLLKRVYTVGEISKIVQKRSDTIRKYEKKVSSQQQKNLVMSMQVIPVGDTILRKRFIKW